MNEGLSAGEVFILLTAKMKGKEFEQYKKEVKDAQKITDNANKSMQNSSTVANKKIQSDLDATGKKSQQTAKYFRDASGRIHKANGKYASAADIAKASADDIYDTKESFEEAGHALDDTGNKAVKNTKRIKAMAVAFAAVGTAAAVGLKSAVNKAADFEEQMSKLGAVSEASAEQMKELKEQALEQGAATKYSATEAASAQIELAKGGLAVKDIMDGGLQSSLSLAAAGELELAEAASITVDAMNTFGLSAKDTSKIADALAGSANATTLDVADLAESFKSGGSMAKQLGYDIEETTLAFSALSTIGIKGQEAGTTLRSAFTQILNPSKKAQAAMKKYNLEFKNAEGEMKSVAEISEMLRKNTEGLTKSQRTSLFTTIAGSYGFKTLSGFYDTSSQKLDTYNKAIRDKGVADRVSAKQQDNLRGKIEQFQGAIETLQIRIGDKLIPILKTVTIAATQFVEDLMSGKGAAGQIVNALENIGKEAAKLLPALKILGQVTILALTSIYKATKQLVDIWKSLPGPVQDFVVGIAAAGATLLVISKIAAGVIALKNAFIALKASIMAIRVLGVAALGPLGIAIIAIGALIYVLIKNWDDVKEVVSSVAKSMKNAINNAINFVVNTAKKGFALFKSAARNGFLGPIPLIISRWKDIVKIISNVLSSIRNRISSIFNSIKNRVVNTFNDIVGFVSSIPDKIINVFKGVPGAIVNLFKGLGKKIGDAIGDVPEAVWGKIKSLPGSALEKISPFAKGGHTKGAELFIAGEKGTETVLSDDPRYRKNNIGYMKDWAERNNVKMYAKGGHVNKQRARVNRGRSLLESAQEKYKYDERKFSITGGKVTPAEKKSLAKTRSLIKNRMNSQKKNLTEFVKTLGTEITSKSAKVKNMREKSALSNPSKPTSPKATLSPKRPKRPNVNKKNPRYKEIMSKYESDVKAWEREKANYDKNKLNQRNKYKQDSENYQKAKKAKAAADKQAKKNKEKESNSLKKLKEDRKKAIEELKSLGVDSKDFNLDILEAKEQEKQDKQQAKQDAADKALENITKTPQDAIIAQGEMEAALALGTPSAADDDAAAQKIMGAKKAKLGILQSRFNSVRDAAQKEALQSEITSLAQDIYSNMESNAGSASDSLSLNQQQVNFNESALGIVRNFGSNIKSNAISAFAGQTQTAQATQGAGGGGGAVINNHFKETPRDPFLFSKKLQRDLRTL